jgi:hypothetical protein
MLSKPQQGIFRHLVALAWQAQCKRDGSDPALPESAGMKDQWYRQELVRDFHCYTTKEIDGRDETLFDKLCLHFAMLSGDTQEIKYWAETDERRARYRMQLTMQKAGISIEYVRGIARRMGLRDDLENLPAASILKLNTAIYLYSKRKEKECVPF